MGSIEKISNSLSAGNVLDEQLPFPILVARSSALHNNFVWHNKILKQFNALNCPHVKNFMSPSIAQLHLANGAWGFCVGTLDELDFCLRNNVRNIIYANQLVGRYSVTHIAELLREVHDTNIYFQVSNMKSINLLLEIARTTQKTIDVFLELGQPKSRSGCKTEHDAREVAKEINRHKPALRFSGICGFEEDVYSVNDTGSVKEFMGYFSTVLDYCDKNRFLDGDKAILTAGGSAFFDIVADEFSKLEAKLPIQIITQCGSFLMSAARGYYRNAADRVQRAFPTVSQTCQYALEIWAYVTARPAPDVVTIGAGRRKLPTDEWYGGISFPDFWFRPHLHESVPVPLRSCGELLDIHEHHAIFSCEEDSPLMFGDIVGFTVSDPGNAVYKFRNIHEVTDRYINIATHKTQFVHD